MKIRVQTINLGCNYNPGYRRDLGAPEKALQTSGFRGRPMEGWEVSVALGETVRLVVCHIYNKPAACSVL